MVCAVMDFAMSKYCSKLLQYFMNSQKLIQLHGVKFLGVEGVSPSDFEDRL